MASDHQTFTISRTQFWTARVLTALAVLFLLFDSAGKVLRLAPVVEGTTRLGYPENAILGIGIVQLICLCLYAVPRTSVLGAILLTGYLGGAVATHVRVGDPLLTHVLFPTYIAALIWGGLYLRENRLRSLLPLRKAGLASEVGRIVAQHPI